MPAGPNDFTSYPGEDTAKVHSRAGSFAGRLSPLRFTEFPSEREARTGVIRPQPEARRTLDAFLGSDDLPCPNKCGWSTVIPPSAKDKKSKAASMKIAQNKVRIHKADCDAKRALAKEKGQSPEALAEASRRVAAQGAAASLPSEEVLPTRADIVKIVSEVLDQKLAGFVDRVKRAVAASKPPRRKRAKSPRVPRAADEAAGPPPVPRVVPEGAAVVDPAPKPNKGARKA